MYEEIKNIDKEKFKNLDLETLHSLQFLNACTKETLRIDPTGFSGTPRVVVKDFELCGKKIFKGDRVTYSQMAVQGSEELYESPMSFNPDRFIGQKPKHKFAFIPFLTGPRACVGQHMGEMVVKLVGLAMIRRFEFEGVDGYMYKKVLGPLYGYKDSMLVVRERED